MWKDINHLIDFLSNWFEVIGFIIGIFVAIKVFFINRDIKTLNKRHLYHQRIDEHLIELKTYSRSLADLIPTYKSNIKDIRLVAATCRVNCLSLKKKVEKKELANLVSMIKASKSITGNKLDISKEPNFFQKLFKQNPISENQLDNYYETLASLISEIEHLNQDIKKTLK